MKAFAVTIVAAALSGCVDIEQRVQRDAKLVRAELACRVSVEEIDVRGSLDESVRELARDGVSADEAVRIALLNNRGVRAAYAELEAESAELVRATLLPNPLLQANAKFFDHGTELELGLVQPLVATLLLPVHKRAAEAEFDATRTRITRELVGLVFDVRRALVELAAARRDIELGRKVLEASEASADLMRTLWEAGNATGVQLAVEEVALGRARVDLTTAEGAGVDARETLNRLLGLWGKAAVWAIDVQLGEEINEGLAQEHVERRAVAASLDLREQRARVDSLAQAAGIAGWEAVAPSSEMGLVAEREAGDGWGLGPTFAIGLPLFGRGSAGRFAARARLSAALEIHYALAVEVRSAARTFRDRTLALGERARLLRVVYLPARARVVRETLKNYNAMQIGAFEVLLARQQEIDAEREYLMTLRQAWLARLDLEALLAGHLDHNRLENWAMPSGPAAVSGASKEH